ncbi:MAG: lysylphosphatidylglycerol synthase transmembrane domain-containing protein [Anaerolineae bacterium]
MMRRVFRPHWLLFLAGLVLLAAVLRTVPLAETWAVLRRLGPRQIGLLIAANGLVLLTFSGRWWLILQAQGQRIAYGKLAIYRLAAFGVSYFTPGPQFGGEPLQVYLTTHRDDVPPAAAVAAVALDKTLELLVNFAFLAAGLAVVLALQGRGLPELLPAAAQPQAISGAALLLALPVAALAALWTGRHPLSTPVAALARRMLRGRAGLARLADVLREAEAQVTAFCRRSPGALGAALAASVISWVALIGEYWLASWFLGARPTIWQMVAALTGMRLALLVPLPGGLGVLEASQALTFAALGFSPALGIALGLLIRARDIALGAAGLGLASVLAEGRMRQSKTRR